MVRAGSILRRPRLAALCTVFYPFSHADVILSRWMTPYSGDTIWGRAKSKTDIASLWMEQCPKNNIGEEFASKNHVPIYNNLEEALTLGTNSLAVDGVLLLAEHGEYERNEKGQILYPRKEWFDRIVNVFRQSGRSVPIFCDKHLSWNPAWVIEMVATAKNMEFPLLSGSSIPTAYRLKEPIVRSDDNVAEAVGIFYCGVEDYGFHSLELLEEVIEKRKGGKSGVIAITARIGDTIWSEISREQSELINFILLRGGVPNLECYRRNETHEKEPIMFSLEHQDGMTTHHLMLNGHVQEFLIGIRLSDGTMRMDRAKMGNMDSHFGHFASLISAIEEMILTGIEPTDARRSLFNSLTLAACCHALTTPGRRISNLITDASIDQAIRAVNCENTGSEIVVTENSAISPIAKLEEDGYDWFARHEEILRIKDNLNPEIVFIGDSITHAWGGMPTVEARATGERILNSYFGKYRILNLGFGWDRTQNVLWRLDHREIENLCPKFVIINIGTNNTSSGAVRSNSAEEIFEGIKAVCERIYCKLPKSHIVLMAIFPREPNPGDPRRILIEQTNHLLANYARGQSIGFVDIRTKLLDKDGYFLPDVTKDFCHLEEKGYLIWAEALSRFMDSKESHPNKKPRGRIK